MAENEENSGISPGSIIGIVFASLSALMMFIIVLSFAKKNLFGCKCKTKRRKKR